MKYTKEQTDQWDKDIEDYFCNTKIKVVADRSREDNDELNFIGFMNIFLREKNICPFYVMDKWYPNFREFCDDNPDYVVSPLQKIVLDLMPYEIAEQREHDAYVDAMIAGHYYEE